MSRAPPRSFNFEISSSTKYGSNRMLRWFDKYLKLDPPPCDPRAEIKGIVKVPGGIDELIYFDSSKMCKYICAFVRRLKPDMFNEPADVVVECLDNKQNYKPPIQTLKLYKFGSFESNLSALISGLNRHIIKCNSEEINQNEDPADIDLPNIININDGQWLMIQQVKQKMVKILFCHQIHANVSRHNKESNSLSVESICKIYQNLHRLTKNATPKVCIDVYVTF